MLSARIEIETNVPGGIEDMEDMGSSLHLTFISICYRDKAEGSEIGNVS